MAVSSLKKELGGRAGKEDLVARMLFLSSFSHSSSSLDDSVLGVFERHDLVADVWWEM